MAAQENITAAGATDEISGGNVPIACTLIPADLAAQACWERLAARAMTGRAQTAQGIRLWFRGEPGTEDELRALVAVETDCCAWATWTVQAGDGQVVLDVRSSGAGVAALHGMFTSPDGRG